MNDQQKLTRATLTPVGKESERVYVHFNPVSLQYDVALSKKDEQFTGKGTAKVAMDLVFDTTDTGVDVRTHTLRVLMLLRPAAGSDPKAASKLAPPQVLFEWGAFSFTGVMESFAETLDFWSASGVPLRSSMKVTLSAPEYVFPESAPGGGAPPDVFLPGGSPGGAAAAGGNPDASRGIAAANGLESLRASASGGLVIPAVSADIVAAASFSPPSPPSIGASLDITAGVGGSLSAGVSVLDGAFGGLHTESVRASVSLSPEKLLAALPSPPLPPGATFDVSGRALAPDGSAFRADVRGSVQFDS